MQVEDCQDFTKLFRELSFNLMLDKNMPLLTLEEIFVEYDEMGPKYFCFIKMMKAECDLTEVLKKGKLDFT